MRYVVIGVIYSIAIHATWCIVASEASLEVFGKSQPNERRQACEVNEDLHSRIYPPEKYSDNAVKLAMVLPVVKDVHIRIAQLSLEYISMRIHIYRKSDSVFNFRITGQGDAPNASLKMFIKDMRFATPSERWAALIAKGLAKVESFVTSYGRNIHTTQLKQVPVNVGLAMSADFEVGKEGAWNIIEDSKTHSIDIDIGDRHPLMWLVNEVIDGYGGKDRIFFDKVWPLVKMLIHPSMGSAFQAVPVSAGEISMSFDISGHCVSPGKQGCDKDEVKLKVEVAVNVNAELHHIVQRLAANSSSDTFMGSVYEHLALSYDKGLDITGSGFLRSDVTLDPGHSIGLSASPNVALQMPLVSSVLGSIEHFLPEVGDLTANVGKARVEGGKIFLDEVDLANLHLPINAEEAVSIDRVHLEDVVMEPELDESSGAEPPGIFNSLSASSNSVYFKLGRENGLRVGPVHDTCDKNATHPDCDSVVVATLAKRYVKNLLDSVGQCLQTPLNSRSASKEEADGALPKEFQPPLPEERAYLDVDSLLKFALGAISLKIDQAQDNRTQLSIVFPFEADVVLTPGVYRGIMESQASDFGYVYLSVPIQSGKTRSLATLSCGSLKIYNAVNESDPFQKKPTYSVDLVDIVETDLRNIDKTEKDLAGTLKAFIAPEVIVSVENKFQCCCRREMVKECRPVDMTDRNYSLPKKFGSFDPASCGWMIGSGWSRTDATKCHYLKCIRFGGHSEIAGKVVCGMPVQISSLQDAIVLQLQRFIDAARRGKPDATWFKEFNPYDIKTIFPSLDQSATPVISPHTEWKEASKPLLWE